MTGWKYYNRAMIPDCPPHKLPDTAPLISGDIWKQPRPVLLARYTSDFDCAVATNWWYVIKDTPFDMTLLKAKRRYEITKGNRYFTVRRLLDPVQYSSALYEVQVAAFSAYPTKYRPSVDKGQFIASVASWKKPGTYVYGAFSAEGGRLCGYARLTENGQAVNFCVLKTRPESEKLAVNAAIVYAVLEDFKQKLTQGYYIYDGERSILHETAFQDYLEKYFGFRKAYCHLHIVYNPMVNWIVKLLYPVRSLFLKLDSIGIVHQINAVLRMEEICRKGGIEE